MIDAVSLTDETLAISGPHGFTQLSGVPSDTDTPPYERLRHLHGKFVSPFLFPLRHLSVLVAVVLHPGALLLHHHYLGSISLGSILTEPVVFRCCCLF